MKIHIEAPVVPAKLRSDLCAWLIKAGGDPATTRAVTVDPPGLPEAVVMVHGPDGRPLIDAGELVLRTVPLTAPMPADLIDQVIAAGTIRGDR